MDGDVQGGGGFVGQQHFRAQSQGLSNYDALFLTTRKLVGIVVHAFLGFRDSHLTQGIHRDFSGFDFVDLAVCPKTFGDLPTHGENRVQGG